VVELQRRIRVACTEELTIPARTQVLIFAKTRPIVNNEVCGLVEMTGSFFPKYGVQVAKAIVKSIDGMVPVKILNAHSSDVLLPADVTVADFTEMPEMNTVTLVEDPLDLTMAEDSSQEDHSADDTRHPVEKIDLSGCQLTEPQKLELHDLLRQFRHLFVDKPEELGCCRLLEHEIDVQGHPPIRSRAYRVSPEQRDVIEEEVQKMHSKGVIRPSKSPWSSPIVLVKKRDNSWRFCTDFRKLNQVTRGDSMPLPPIEHALSFGFSRASPKIFSTLDLASGFWQSVLSEDSKCYTAFTTGWSLWEYERLPFGLANAPAHFQRLMQLVLSGLLWVTTLVYIDDVIIYSPSFEQHLVHLRQVLERLDKAGLKLHPNKCTFGQTEVKYLGHIVSADGISMDPEKCRVVSELKHCTSVKEVRSFLGITGYYRRFLKDYSRIVAPLTRLLSKGVPFAWTSECDDVMTKLKTLLTTAPAMLAYPREDLTYHLYTDACNVSIGSQLCQEVDGVMRTICFGGRLLSKSERNYCTTEKECLALVDAVKRYRVYLSNKPFVAVTDHRALVWLMKCKDNNQRLLRWSLALQGYDFTIKHQSGRLLQVADGLSRLPYETDENVVMSLHTNDFDLAQLQRGDPFLLDFIHHIETGKLPEDNQRAAQVKRDAHFYFLDDGGVLKRATHSPHPGREKLVEQVVVPNSLHRELLLWSHESPTAGHFGRDRTYHKLASRYFWHSMRKDVESWVRGCVSCQSRKTPPAMKRAPLQPIVSSEPWERLIMDIKGPLVQTKAGNKYILVVMDHFTKFAVCTPLRTQTSREVADVLFREIICRYGAFRVLQSDQAADFLSKLISELCSICGISKVHSTSYHPMSQGLVERLNRTLAAALSVYVSDKQDDWDLYLPGICWGYNTSPSQQSTTFTPYYMLYGRQPLQLHDTVLTVPTGVPRAIREHLSIIVRNLEIAQEIARTNLAAVRKKMKDRYDDKAALPDFQVGDLVWLYVPRVKVGLSKTLGRFYTGPFSIVEKVSENNFKVRTWDNRKVPQVVHSNRLKRFYHDDRTRLEPPTDPLLEGETDDQIPGEFIHPAHLKEAEDQALLLETDLEPLAEPVLETGIEAYSDGDIGTDVYTVEHLLKKRYRKGTVQYLVKWQGYPHSENTWEPEENIIDKKLIADFEGR
jgi:transposase InsO family protein